MVLNENSEKLACLVDKITMLSLCQVYNNCYVHVHVCRRTCGGTLKLIEDLHAFSLCLLGESTVCRSLESVLGRCDGLL
mgnify:CR=1 FL=1